MLRPLVEVFQMSGDFNLIICSLQYVHRCYKWNCQDPGAEMQKKLILGTFHVGISSGKKYDLMENTITVVIMNAT